MPFPAGQDGDTGAGPAEGSGQVPIYVINLARSADRREHMRRQLDLAGLAYCLVPAVDGRCLDVGDRSLISPDLIGHRLFTPGGAACALSHLKTYRQVLEDGHDFALVLEDDGLLPADLGEVASAAARAVRADDVVLFNFHSPRPARLRHEDRLALPGGRWLARPVDGSQISSGGAYLIGREALAKVLAINLPVRAFNDEWHLLAQMGAIATFYCVSPMPVENSPCFRTTIDPLHRSDWRSAAHFLVDHVHLPALSRAIYRRRSESFRRWGWSGDEVFVADDASAGGR